MRDCSAVCARNASSRVYTVAHVSRVGRLRNQACFQLRCVHTDNASVITYNSQMFTAILLFFFFFLIPARFTNRLFSTTRRVLVFFFHISLEKNFETRLYIYRSILCNSWRKVWFKLINVSLIITILQYEIRIPISNDFSNYRF